MVGVAAAYLGKYAHDAIPPVRSHQVREIISMDIIRDP
jgi:hypothetical protein